MKHQSAKTNELITGIYQHDGDAVVAGDTDSSYFSAWPIIKDEVLAGTMEWTKEIVIKLYDSIGEQVNESFPSFMEQAFHCPRKHGEIIKTAREIVGDRGLFIKKKRYAIRLIDKDGKRLDMGGEPGKIKAMGLDLKRSDTPKYIQDFLMGVLEMTLDGKSKDDIIAHVMDYKEWLSKEDPWSKGSPKSVNNLTNYHDKLERAKTGKATMPGHVRASLNWNTLRRLHNDNYSMKITDGMRISVCKLRPNPMEYTSIAYPVDESHLPQWFKELPFDVDSMESILIDTKLDNLLGVLKWDLRLDTSKSNINDFFTFG